MKQTVRNSVPVDFEIERWRKMVKNLVPDIRKNMHVIAQEEVEVERLEKANHVRTRGPGGQGAGRATGGLKSRPLTS